ncbi:MAG: protein-glutamate O-methyltransferase CheR [Gammaproteobacteria bacterium]
MTTLQPGASNAANAGANEDFLRSVLDIVRTRTGVDFTCYRAAMLERRIANHVASSGATSNEDYLQRLQVSPAAAFRLLERITIKVSRFHRHAPTFEHLRDTLLPQLAHERDGQPLRIWCAGCGAGEEAYTFAMLLEDAGVDGFIEATDVDASVLNGARAGIYPLTAAVELPAALSAAFLEPVVEDGRAAYRVHDRLRTRVRFSRHDITSNAAPPRPSSAPGSASGSAHEHARFDLVSCRNVLIYLQRAAQVRATQRLLDATRENGVLCLGEAEWPLPELATELEPLPHRTRLFRLRPPLPFGADHELNRARFRTSVRAVASAALEAATRTVAACESGRSEA